MESKNLQVFGHLEELRNRIIKTLTGFLAFMIVSFLFVEEIYKWLIKDLDGKLTVLGPGEILWVYMVIAAVFAIAATIPLAAFQTWRFVAPALKKEERKVTLRFIPGLFFLFIAGISFGYFVLFPIVLGFLISLSAGQFETMFTAEKYFRFMINLILPFGFLFEMPLLVMFLTRLGILNPMRLAKGRKLSYFVLVIVSILITPPDLISDILVIVPLLVLYEASVLLSAIVYRKRLKREGTELSVA
ncbi:twin-arginine translocase subunit TatC [Bacillus canaveralius]|uniref:Sec-independent protein translocase protein TatC n=1 Tax=Bacillus canaveralius TaxID=1403243 RepID=A0A2N5GSI8_9BACI|nr:MULTISPECIES: twin-arginine translocase subunit TatC [Bacillus]PLR84889.1 twin-arginine translocase subunit TatC [Bacillus sp. V33-4]PLR86737.1 twin-arginine translocase subunit TatC [Bacillus canaveralius]PLR92801.1 twin-arginine translocase subunit TatC [Bacillus canaveralius]